MSGGTADFFYREARRLKYVARSAFKVILSSLNQFLFVYLGGVVRMQCGESFLPTPTTNLGFVSRLMCLLFELLCERFTVGGDTKETSNHSTRQLCTGSRVRPGRLPAGLLADCASLQQPS